MTADEAFEKYWRLTDSANPVYGAHVLFGPCRRAYRAGRADGAEEAAKIADEVARDEGNAVGFATGIEIRRRLLDGGGDER